MTKKRCVATGCETTGPTVKCVGNVVRGWYTKRKVGSQNMRCRKHR